MSAQKLAPEADVATQVRAHQAAGRRVVFTNGAFDLFHAGHVSVLESAAAEGDVLVVGVNADDTVRRAKGPRRPVVRAAERARVVAALACVDHVLVFDDETVDRLLEALRPDVHAKGLDYGDETLPERATNDRLGIEMRFVGAPKRHASSSVMARAAAAGRPAADRVLPLGDPVADGFVNRRVRRRLQADGWLDFERLSATQDGDVVAEHGARVVRRLEMGGDPVFLQRARPMDRAGSAILGFQNHLALRAVGLRAPEPWLAVEGRIGKQRVGVLVTREAPGVPLDRFVDEHLEGLSPRARLRAAAGVGRALRALHTARFLPPCLEARHLLVDGEPADGAPAFTFTDLRGMRRPSGRVEPKQGAPGLAALARSLEYRVPAGLMLAALRAYLGGSLRASNAWLAAINKVG